MSDKNRLSLIPISKTRNRVSDSDNYEGMKFDDPNSYTLNEALIRDIKYRYVDITTNEKGEKLTKGDVLLVHGYPDTCG